MAGPEPAAGEPGLGAGLYLHVPFCSRICPYCDFAVITGGRERRRRFADSLLAEIAMLGEGGGALAGSAGFDTVYLGGGTPSALEPGELARVLAAAAAALPLRDPWIFFEANPEDVSPEALRAWRQLGVRTLSLGVQAFDEPSLRFLGRRHGPEQARRSVLLAREAGFDTVSLDLIYGLPEDSPARWRQTLETAVELAPDHLSCYQLTVHEGTPFGFRAARGQLAELPEDAQADLFLLTHDFLNGNGYQGYEVSSFARGARHRSRHNRKYWDHTPYLGLGPSAHSFSGLGGFEAMGGPGALAGFEGMASSGDLGGLGGSGGFGGLDGADGGLGSSGGLNGSSDGGELGGVGVAGGGRRWWNERKLHLYEAKLAAGERPVAGSEVLSRHDLALEAAMLGLRTYVGIDLGRFRDRFGIDLSARNQPLLDTLAAEGLLDVEAGALVPTLRGLAVADSIARRLDLGE